MTLAGSGSDPEGDAIVRYLWIAPDSVTLSDASSASPSFTAPEQLAEDRVLEFSLEVTDARGAVSDPVTVTITVTADNGAPNAHAGPAQTVDEGATVTLDGTASSDPEDEVLSYAWSGSNGVTLTGATPSFDAPVDLVADLDVVFTLTVTDASGNDVSVNDDTNTVTITVTAGDNSAPTVIVDMVVLGSDPSIAEGKTVTLSATGSSDSDGAMLSFAWSGPPDVPLDDPTSATPSFTAPMQLLADRELVFILVITDASGNVSGPMRVTIMVVAGLNDPPIADAGPDQTVAEGETVTLNGSGSSDPEDETLTFAWTPPTGVTLDNINSATPGFTAPEQLVANRELEFILVVTDASGNASSDTVTITVTAGNNDAPTVMVDMSVLGPNPTIAEGETVTLDATGSFDPEGEMLSFAWSGPPDVPLTGADTPTPSFTAPMQLLADRELEFSLVVSDASGNASESMTITITVTAGSNDPPIADAGLDQTVAEDKTVTLDGAGSSDPEGENLTFEWTTQDDVTLTGANTATASFTAPELMVNDEDIELVFTLTVSDASGNSATDTVTITVTANPLLDIIIMVAPPTLAIREGEMGRYTVKLSADPEGEVAVIPSSDNDDVTLSAARLEFNTGNWNQPQMVTVTARKDSGRAVITHTFEGQNMVPGQASSVTVIMRDVDPIIAPVSDFMLNRANALVDNQPGLVRFLKQGAAADSPGFKLAKASQGRFGFAGSLGNDGVWGSLTGAWSESDTTKSRHVFGSLGKHKWYADNRLVGMLLQFDMADDELPNSEGAIDGTGWLMGPYFAARHSTQPLYFEGRLLWGQSYNQIRFEDPALGQRTGDFDSTRWLAQLRMEGEISLGTSRLQPYVDASWTEDSSSGFTDDLGIRVPGLTVRLGQLRLGSNIKIPVAVKQGEMTITGGLGMTPSYTDNNDPDPALSQTRARADFGIDYKLNKNTYLNFDSHYDGIGVSDYKSFGLSFSAEFKF